MTAGGGSSTDSASSDDTVTNATVTALAQGPAESDVAATTGPDETPDASVTADANTGTAAVTFGPERVAVVGDSLAVATEHLIGNAIRSQGASEVRINAVEGRRMTGRSDGRPAGADAVSEIIESGFAADLWVIELGTNDLGADIEPETFRADMESILAMLPEGTPVVWVNVHLGFFTDTTDEANAIIDSVAAARPNTWVADWNSIANDEPDLLTDDGVHLHDSGEVAYSLAISLAVAEAGDT